MLLLSPLHVYSTITLCTICILCTRLETGKYESKCMVDLHSPHILDAVDTLIART